MTRLKFSNKEIDHVCHLILNHMFYYEPNWTNAAVRRFLVQVGSENLEICKILCDAGADVDISDQMGMSAYNYAVLFKKQKLVDILTPFHKSV